MGVWTKKRGSMEYVVLLDSTLREGQLGAWLISSKRLTGDSNAEQGGMQDTQLCSAPACAPHALVPCAHARTSAPGPHRLGPFILSWSISIDSHKAKQREVTSDLCLNQLQIPLTLALKRGLRHPPSLGTQGIYTKIYTVDASGIQVSNQNHIHINMENDQKIAHRVNCVMIKKLTTEATPFSL